MYEPSRHITSFNIAGFQHWDGALVLSELKPGMQLTLVPEPETPMTPTLSPSCSRASSLASCLRMRTSSSLSFSTLVTLT